MDPLRHLGLTRSGHRVESNVWRSLTGQSPRLAGYVAVSLTAIIFNVVLYLLFAGFVIFAVGLIVWNIPGPDLATVGDASAATPSTLASILFVLRWVVCLLTVPLITIGGADKFIGSMMWLQHVYGVLLEFAYNFGRTHARHAQ